MDGLVENVIEYWVWFTNRALRRAHMLQPVDRGEFVDRSDNLTRCICVAVY